jgi:hypothetical protein
MHLGRDSAYLCGRHPASRGSCRTSIARLCSRRSIALPAAAGVLIDLKQGSCQPDRVGRPNDDRPASVICLTFDSAARCRRGKFAITRHVKVLSSPNDSCHDVGIGAYVIDLITARIAQWTWFFADMPSTAPTQRHWLERSCWSSHFGLRRIGLGFCEALFSECSS